MTVPGTTALWGGASSLYPLGPTFWKCLRTWLPLLGLSQALVPDIELFAVYVCRYAAVSSAAGGWPVNGLPTSLLRIAIGGLADNGRANFSVCASTPR
jgi:hypothetical protein